MASDSKFLGRIEDFPASGLRQVEVGEEKILLIRRAGKITAINGTCPHAGAPLAEGVLHGGSVICPWHKAAFSAGSGKCLEPPAVDDVATYDLNIIDGDIFLAGERPAAPAPHSVQDDRVFVIIGAGAAGFSAAQELRAQNFAGRILLLDAAGALPYDRTILSKYTLAGTKGDEKTPLQDKDFYRREKIERQTATVRALDPLAQTISLADGDILKYDAALIATGGAARKLPVPGANLANIFTLRNQDDAARIIAKADHAKRAVIIGTGFIGMEAAAALRERGLEVTVVGQEAAPFEKQLGAEIGSIFQKIHEEQGVKFRLNAKIAALEGEGAVTGIRLESGETLRADLVIAGLGVTPITEFVTGAARDEHGGLITGPNLKIADHLFAAGDVATFPLHGRGQKIRVEHWRVAQQQGRVVAQAMLGLDTVYDSVPVFWTIQYNKRLDYIGHASGQDEIVIRGDLGEQNFIAYFVQDGIVKAAAGMNQDANMAAVLALMTAKQDWRIENLHPETATPRDVLNHREGRE